MKKLLLAAVAVSLFVGALALSGQQKQAPSNGLQVEVEQRNPWTHLRLNNDPGTFHFVVVSDRTGGHRARVFSQAVEQINLLQPAFVLSVGDLIEGYTKDQGRVQDEWKEFQGYTGKLNMPFFYVPGNHDTANPMQTKEWESRFGRRYYHFVYKDVLFLGLHTDDPNEAAGAAMMSKEQVEWVDKVLKENAKVRWTVIALHKPIWDYPNLDKNGWLEVEKSLSGRNYTVFAGHIHQYRKFVRQGMNYYQLATTGGGSKLRGLHYGEFDHIVWATMKKDGPVLANIMLEGIYPEDLSRPATAEDAYVRYGMKPVYPVTGKVLVEGTPLAGAKVQFHLIDADGKKFTPTADAFTSSDGSFALSTYKAFDGAPTGQYAVTVVWRDPYYDATGKLSPNRLPTKYAAAKDSDLRAKVTSDPNEVTLNLAK